jgi:spermidine synthase
VQPRRQFDAILVDIDHSPRDTLHPSHSSLYDAIGLKRVMSHLRPDGVFALWSNDPPDRDFLDILSGVFVAANAEVITFFNPLQDREATNTVYVARTSPAA